jgi:hypothetical protein
MAHHTILLRAQVEIDEVKLADFGLVWWHIFNMKYFIYYSDISHRAICSGDVVLCLCLLETNKIAFSLQLSAIIIIISLVLEKETKSVCKVFAVMVGANPGFSLLIPC